MKAIQTKNVLFITGAFVTNLGWEPWKAYFESKGYQTANPAWPYKEGTAAEARQRHPDAAGLGSLTIQELLAHFINIIKQYPEPPILIGHSYGGLITQLLINRGYGAAGIAIHSVPPFGVLTLEPSFFKATWGPLGFFTNVNKPFLMNLSQWQYAFTNGMSLEEQERSYYENVIPESKRISRGGVTPAAKVDFKKPHAPLLIMSGSEDHIMPASLNLSNFKKYKQDNGSVTDYKEFKGRNHFVVGAPGWKENADYILDWIEKK